ncbi:MAG TPA: phosphorylase [Roseiarcus sp.]|nr:phosphorylase [Roseiarcus sp.]
MIVITGMRAEARIASAPGVKVFACGGNVGLRAAAIRHAVCSGAPAIVSFGIAGGLLAHMNPGHWIVATGVSAGAQHIETDAAWTARLVERLPQAEVGDIVSVAAPVRRPHQKRHLQASTGACGVDMESFQAATLAHELGVPFAAVRVVADPLERELPAAVHSGLQSDGSVAMSAVLSSLAREPGQMGALARVTVDAFVAFRALLAGRDKLGPRFASLTCPTVVASRARAEAATAPHAGAPQAA